MDSSTDTEGDQGRSDGELESHPGNFQGNP